MFYSFRMERNNIKKKKKKIKYTLQQQSQQHIMRLHTQNVGADYHSRIIPNNHTKCCGMFSDQNLQFFLYFIYTDFFLNSSSSIMLNGTDCIRQKFCYVLPPYSFFPSTHLLLFHFCFYFFYIV